MTNIPKNTKSHSPHTGESHRGYISKVTTDRVKEAINILEIIEQYVDLKKSGSSWKGKSPFTDEKTPSFFVVPSKQIFKCHSSGIGGDAIAFLMEYKKFSYPEAIEFLANHYSIPIEHEAQTEESRARYEEQANSKKMNATASAKWVQIARSLPDDHPALEQLQRLSDDSRVEWQVGYIGDDHKFIFHLTNYFQKRVMFPIHNIQGDIIAFGARAIGDNKPKYINSENSDVYVKGNHLYGIFHSVKSIAKSGTAILVEGYTDVIGFHESGITNTVGTLGTALTEIQVKTLKKYAKTICIVRDADRAGRDAAVRDMEMILPTGMTAEIVLLPDGMDPYNLARIEDAKKYIDEHAMDALEYFSGQLMNDAVTPAQKADVLTKVAAWVDLIPDPFVQKEYTKSIAKLLKVKGDDISEKRKKDSKQLQHNKSKFGDLKPGEKICILFSEHLPDIKRNVITGEWEVDGDTLTEEDFNSLILKFQNITTGISENLFYRYLKSNEINSYNPINQFFENHKEIKKTGLIKALAETIETDTGMTDSQFNPNFVEHFLTKWMVGAVAQAYGRGVNPLMPILAGTRQNSGKTEWFRRLLPAELKVFYAEPKGMADMKDADLGMLLCENFMIMDDDMASRTWKDFQRMKSMLSTSSYTMRRPYDKRQRKYPRLASIAATDNNLDLLRDPTGNRRMIPIHVLSINHDAYNAIDKTALWLEAYHLMEAGFDHNLRQEDIRILNECTKDFEVVDETIELIGEYFLTPDECATGIGRMTATQVAGVIMRYSQFRNLHPNRIGERLRKMGYDQKRDNSTGSRTWVIEPKINYRQP